jgi:hypothetical protein
MLRLEERGLLKKRVMPGLAVREGTEGISRQTPAKCASGGIWVKGETHIQPAARGGWEEIKQSQK